MSAGGQHLGLVSAFPPSKVDLGVAAAVRLTVRLMSTLLVHLCSGLLLAPRVAVRFDHRR